MRITASICGVVATPIKLSTDTEMTGPAITRRRGRQRSASLPNPICATDAAS